MNILLTNDDGIFAPGLQALRQILNQEHQVLVVAPDAERSAVGHSITLADPIRVKKAKKNGEFWGYSISGTPADCVRLGVAELMPGPVDVVASGINLGANVGINVLYSGTVSAATEAAILGLPAAAFSLDTFTDPDYTFAASLARSIINKLTQFKLAPGICLNINVPALPADMVKGAVWARLMQDAAGEEFIRRVDPRNNVYFWRGKEQPPPYVDPGSDYALLAKGYVTITPISHDLTNYHELTRLKDFPL